MRQPTVSVVVPIYNEIDNLGLLHRRLSEALAEQSRSYEILLVDDGSTDGSIGKMIELTKSDPCLRVIELRRNFGQTAAMFAGIQNAIGQIVVTIDGDLQNEPDDIPMMLDKLDQGFDLVHGKRTNRQDGWLLRRLPSKMANWLIARVTRFPVTDLGCTLKVFRREFAQELELYGEMHRFIPILAHQRGARCVEVPTRHHARKFGETKYGIDRTIRVILDLITVKYMLKYFSSPMKLFGLFGILCLCMAAFAFAASIGLKIFAAADMTSNPLLLFSGLMGLGSLQFFSLGLIGEVCARIYFANPGKTSYAIRRQINSEGENQDQPGQNKYRLVA